MSVFVVRICDDVGLKGTFFGFIHFFVMLKEKKERTHLSVQRYSLQLRYELPDSGPRMNRHIGIIGNFIDF